MPAIIIGGPDRMREGLNPRHQAITNSIGCRGVVFAHPEPHVFTHPALLDNFSSVMGNDSSDLVELVRFDDELKCLSRRQNSET